MNKVDSHPAFEIIWEHLVCQVLTSSAVLTGEVYFPCSSHCQTQGGECATNMAHRTSGKEQDAGGNWRQKLKLASSISGINEFPASF